MERTLRKSQRKRSKRLRNRCNVCGRRTARKNLLPISREKDGHQKYKCRSGDHLKQ